MFQLDCIRVISMRYVVFVLVVALGTGCSGLAEDCDIANAVQDALDANFFAGDLSRFDDCVLSGDWPSIYYLAEDEILTLRSDPDFDELLVDFSDFHNERLSTAQTRTILEWIEDGGHAIVYVGLDTSSGRLLEDLFGISTGNPNYADGEYEMSEDENTLWLSDEAGEGISELYIGSYGYAIIEESDEFEMVSIVGGKGLHKYQSIIGAILYGDGSLIYQFSFKGSSREPLNMAICHCSWARWLADEDKSFLYLNVRQWAVDLAL
ncbi:MAG: hypothetical protein E4H08_08840 [Candidatus Atribacteria bacterium]|nr:MAG: hypothetical protein E4H08_08840 [Candidatus Atribacteria bacterium]